MTAGQGLLALLEIDCPIIQAPMAGTSTPEMAAAVSNAGALGSLGLGASSVEVAAKMLAGFRERSPRSLNVNVFCHAPPAPDAARDSRWLARLAPEFARYEATPPRALHEIYRSFREHEAMLQLILAHEPRVVSFHFGLPKTEQIRVLRDAGIVLLGSATNLAEASALAHAGVHAVVAQGYEAGGHRGMFDPAAEDTRLGTLALTRLLVKNLDLPIIAAGGIMDGAGIAAALRLGASAAQLGTAFVPCDESAAEPAYRALLQSEAAHHTVMTAAISGRPARCLANRFTAFAKNVLDAEIAAYPNAYDAGKALHAAAKARAEFGYGANWAGQGAPLARPMPAAELVALLRRELDSAS